MKYELEPDNRNCSDKELLDDLLSVAKQLGVTGLTQSIYNKYGRFCAATFKKRFGTWNRALERSGLSPKKRTYIPSEELLEDLKRVASELGSLTVYTSQYRNHGCFSEAALTKRFGSWSAVLDAAGLKQTGWKPTASDEDLLDNMAYVWEHVGRQPKQKDFHPPVSKYSATTYVKHFGSWRAALEAFVNTANSDQEECQQKASEELVDTNCYDLKKIIHKTSRNPSWRLRFLVMRRDCFACCLCGASPAKDPSVSLQVDHIIPWSKGGETVLSNLQTCCDRCNIGKSDLPLMQD